MGEDIVIVDATAFPRPLSAYAAPVGGGLVDVLWSRVQAEPLNAVVTAIFLLAVCHTFLVPLVATAAHRRHSKLLRLFGEVELVFVLWAVPLVIALAIARGGETVARYLGGVTFTEPLFVVVIMAIASTRPVVELAEGALRRLATRGGSTPAAWWLSILIVAPLLGSFITEPAAMTIGALLLSRQFYDLRPSARLKYATLGLLFVNVSIGGTLTHFAAPPVLMVSRLWEWDTPYMLAQFGWRAALAIAISALIYYSAFRREFQALAARPRQPDEAPPPVLATPVWVTAVYVLCLVWTVVYAHHPARFVLGFLVFLAFDRATAAYSTLTDYRTPVFVGVFLAGLVVHGGLQAWWIAPVLGSLSETPLFLGATFLTAFNDNALITYLATLVPDLDPGLKAAVVQGAVTGGGLTVIANAPNPAGQALLGRFFNGAVHPLWLFAGATVPTLVAAAAFRLI
jgi:hypothetical protein